MVAQSRSESPRFRVTAADPVTGEMLCELLVDHCDSFLIPTTYRSADGIACQLDRLVGAASRNAGLFSALGRNLAGE
jgi:hypothetical protein